MISYQVIGWMFVIFQLLSLSSSQIEEKFSDIVPEIETNEQFEELIEPCTNCVVMFYAPWCGACKKFRPRFEEAHQELHESIQFFTFDADLEEHRTISSRYNATAYPTIVLFREGSRKEYLIGEMTESIVEKIKRQMRLPILPFDIDTPIHVENEVAIIGIFGEKDQIIRKIFQSVNEEFRDLVQFYESLDDSLVEKKLEVQAPSVVMLRNFEEEKIVLSDFDLEKLRNWIIAERFPLFGTITPKNREQYIYAGVPLLIAYTTEDADEGYFQEKLKNLAKEKRHLFKPIFLNWNNFADKAKTARVASSSSIVLEDTQKKIRYVFDYSGKELKEDELREWLEQYQRGELQPTLKSDPIPSTNDEPVKVVVSDSFDEMVVNSPHHVFIMFYAPWCKFCEMTAPTWEELAKTLQKDDIVVAKMDGTNNELSPLKHERISGYPTIRLYKAGSKDKPITYTSRERTLESFLEFLKNNTESIQNDSYQKDEL